MDNAKYRKLPFLKMKKTTTIILLIISQFIIAQCPTGPEIDKNTPKRDFRGVFLASVSSLDWPTNRTATPAVQQAELIVILDKLKANGYNTVFLQIRPEADALFASTIDPWSYWLTGTQGTAPSPVWDPLAFAVTEAHSRGLDLHAWLNPYRVKQTSAMTLASNNVANQHPSWTFQAKLNASDTGLNLKMLNPGIPDVRNYLVSVIQDVASRYDVDGIHFDDYFYPYAGMESPPQDQQTYADYNPTGIAAIEDWRRNNVNLMIGMVYDAIQTINTNQNKNIVFGVSPFGIWKSGTPSGISGNSSYFAQYCDPISWLNAGKVDYLAPQLYWKITGSQDYIALSKWWNDQVKLANKQLYPSEAYYRMNDSSNWAATEIQNQINQNRVANMDATFGQVAYRYTSIKNNHKTINDALNTTQYKYKSFAPPILGTGKDAICPNIPVNIRVEGSSVKWDTPTAASDNDLPVKYVVYAFDNPSQSVSNKEDGSKVLDIVVGNELLVPASLLSSKYFVVSSLDKNNNENGDFSSTLSTSKLDYVDSSWNIYPNPFVEKFTIDNNVAYLGSIEITIYDLSGKLVWKEIYEKNNQKISIEVSPTNLGKGLYIGKIKYKDAKTTSFKLIKQ